MSSPDDRPLGLTFLGWLLWFWAGASFLVVLLLVVGDGPIPLSGRAVAREEALARILPILVPMALAAAGAALALGLQKAWARPAVLLPFVLAAATPALTGVAVSVRDLATGALALAPVIGLLVWYLYLQPGVAAYFRSLREPDAGANGGAGGGAVGQA